MPLRPLTAEEEDLWRALVRLMIVLPRALDEDLQGDAGVSLTHYVVLMALSEAPSRKLRMSDLATRAALSPSRMTRVVQTLEALGLVERIDDSVDGRASNALLTPAGLQQLQQAWPTHLDSARTILFDHLGTTKLPQISAGLRRILAAAEQPLEARVSTPADASQPARTADQPVRS